MVNFKAPQAVGYKEAIEQARLINGALEELHELKRGQMLEFADRASLEAAIDREIATQRRATMAFAPRVRAVA